MTIDQLTTFFGWMSVINIGLLIFSVLMLMLLKPFVSKIHTRLFGVEQKELNIVYMKYTAHYKIMTLIFNVIPYLSLKLIN